MVEMNQQIQIIKAKIKVPKNESSKNTTYEHKLYKTFLA
jgi:hypothetical protein